MHTTSEHDQSGAGFKRRGCVLALLGALAGCGGDASSLIGAALVTSGTTQAVPLADRAGQGASPVGAPFDAASGTPTSASPGGGMP